MIVCLDCGNSRIKWGVHDGVKWLGQGAVDHFDAAALSSLPTAWPNPERVMLANVAGEAVAGHLREQLAPWASMLREVRSEAGCCGVSNHYQDPGRLGVDRWCALLGARDQHDGACLVVMAGTATTIDTLDNEGNFLGGMILPGVELMRRSLASDTAALSLLEGKYSSLPQCTADAILSGVIEAQIGAITRAYLRLTGERAVCLISGGNAPLLAGYLTIPCRQVPNLPLEGLRRLAAEA